MRDVGSMVHAVLTRLRKAKLRQLNIIDHGNERGFELGDDVVTADNIGQHARQLGKLRGRFTAAGFAHLQQRNTTNSHEIPNGTQSDEMTVGKGCFLGAMRLAPSRRTVRWRPKNRLGIVRQ
jgi:hypothetical protein